MDFYPFEVTPAHITYALLGAFVVLFGMFSLFLRERLYIGEAIWAFIFGVIIGPYCANIFDPRSWGNHSEETSNIIILEFTRIVLAVGVFAIAVELPGGYMKKHWKSLFFLLIPVMAWSWLVCAALIYALIPGPDFISSLAISACLTPTDPILASAALGGKWADKHVPGHIRRLLAAVSGCNDGAASPFVFFSLYLLTNLPSLGNAMRDWFLVLWLYEVVLGIVIGFILGFSFRHLMKFCQRHDFIDRPSYVAQYLSLAILTVGVTTLLGSNDILASFTCGIVFTWEGSFNKPVEQSLFSSATDVLFNVAAFIYVGAWMPFGQYHLRVEGMGTEVGLGLEVWRLIVLALLVLLLRRLPIMMAMYRWIPDMKTWREAVFSGHFGPMGIGAIYVAALANVFLHEHVAQHSAEDSDDQRHQIEVVMDMMQPIVAFMVLCSVAVHGLSVPGFSLGKRVQSISSTWSRRESTTSGRVNSVPEWTNQARMVTRGEDIVINRDLEKGEGGKRGVPLERTMTMMSSMRTLNNSKGNNQKEDDSDSLSDEAKPQADPISILVPTVRGEEDKEMDMDLGSKTKNGRDMMNMRGRQKTADTFAVDENTDRAWMAYGGESEEECIAAPASAVVPISSLAPISGPKQGSVIGRDTTPLIVGEERFTSERRNRRRSSSLTRLPSGTQPIDYSTRVQDRRPSRRNTNGSAPETINLTLEPDNYESDPGNPDDVDEGIVEVLRGREGFNATSTVVRRTMSGSNMMLNISIGLGRSSEPATPTGSPSPPFILPPNLPSPIVLPPPASRSRPRTAPPTPTISSPPMAYPSRSLSRPGTGDSTSSIRHHRVDSLRTGGTARKAHRPPTRESSPTRSVRFVDGENGSGGVGNTGSTSSTGNGNGRRVLVVEVPPPLPIPRSSSFYRDNKDGVGKIPGDSVGEEKGPLDTATS